MGYAGAAVTTPINLISAQRRRTARPRHAGANTLWRRIRDNWDDIEAIGTNPDLGTAIGKLYLFGVLSQSEASAGRLYAEVVGRNDRFHGGTQRHIPAPAYWRGSGGRDDEVVRRERNGTVKEYERQAKKAKKAYDKVQRCIPTLAARDLVESLCLYDREVPEVAQHDIKQILRAIALSFGLTDQPPAVETKVRTRTAMINDERKRAAAVIAGMEEWFKERDSEIKTFGLVDGKNDHHGIACHGFVGTSATPLTHVVTIKVEKSLVGALDHAFISMGEAKGWQERQS